jgi:hypothetical protein
MTRSWTSRAAASLVLGGLLAGCATGGAPPQGTGGGTQTITGCGGATITIPAGGDIPSAACSHGPMTSPTPYPVSDEAAIAAAEHFLGSTGLAVYATSLGQVPALLLTGGDSAVVVDGTTGRVLQFFTLAPAVGLPDGAIPSWSPTPIPSAGRIGDAASAIAVASAWLAKHGVTTTRDSGRATLDTIPGANAWRVTLLGGDGRPVDVRVSVAGTVVGYQVGNPPLPLSLPSLDRDAAITLAVERMAHLDNRADDRVIAAEFEGGLQGDGQQIAWIISVGVPEPDASTGGVMWAFGGAIEVDAITGEVTVLKH